MTLPERCRRPGHDGVEGECYACAREAEAAGRCGNCYGKGFFYVEPDPADEMDDGSFPCSGCDGDGSRQAQLAKKNRRRASNSVVLGC